MNFITMYLWSVELLGQPPVEVLTRNQDHTDAVIRARQVCDADPAPIVATEVRLLSEVPLALEDVVKDIRELGIRLAA